MVDSPCPECESRNPGWEDSCTLCGFPLEPTEPKPVVAVRETDFGDDTFHALPAGPVVRHPESPSKTEIVREKPLQERPLPKIKQTAVDGDCPDCGNRLDNNTGVCDICGFGMGVDPLVRRRGDRVSNLSEATNPPAAPVVEPVETTPAQQVAEPVSTPLTKPTLSGPEKIWRLIVVEGYRLGKAYQLYQPQMILGASRPNGPFPDIDLDDQDDGFIEARHLHLQTAENGVWITDLGSGQGTRIGGRALTPDTPILLNEGGVLRVGKVGLQLVSVKTECDGGAV